MTTYEWYNDCIQEGHTLTRQSHLLCLIVPWCGISHINYWTIRPFERKQSGVRISLHQFENRIFSMCSTRAHTKQRCKSMVKTVALNNSEAIEIRERINFYFSTQQKAVPKKHSATQGNMLYSFNDGDKFSGTVVKASIVVRLSIVCGVKWAIHQTLYI